MFREKKSLNEMTNEELIAFIDRRNRNNFIFKSIFLVLLISGSIFASSLLNTKFGIGEVAPVAKLEVKGDGTTSATINTNLKNNANTSLFYVRDDGNIGVGTTVPSAKLHVNGSINASSINTAPAGTKCGLCGDNTVSVETCMGLNVCTSCPIGWTKVGSTGFLFGCTGGAGCADKYCVKN